MASVILPTASSTMSTIPAYVLRVSSSIKLYLSVYFWGASTGPWTFWNAMYKNKGLDENLCDLMISFARYNYKNVKFCDTEVFYGK